MIIKFLLFGGILILSVWSYILRRKSKALEEKNEALENKIEALNNDGFVAMDNDKLQKMMTFLRNMGCQPKLTDEELPRIEVAYQGETFIIGVYEDSSYVLIWDYAWLVMDIGDSRIPIVKECINQMSAEWTMAVYYFNDKERNCFVVSSKSAFHIPTGKYDVVANLEEIFRGMIGMKSALRHKYEEITKSIGEDNSFVGDNSNSQLWN